MEGGKSFLCLFGILLSARITLQASSSDLPYYVGAVVEYHPVTKGDNGTVIADENVKNYMRFLKKANEHAVDIIVFPEGSLTAGRSFPAEERTRYLPHSSYVPDPKDLVTPCKNDSSNVMQALKAVSCAAKQYDMYITINVREKAKCTGENTSEGCSPDSYQLYNTNVVFNRQGVVVARYRKYNLFGEAGFNKTPKSELSTFTTDFGVKFGQFVCFDVLFDDPALRLVRESKITDYVFTSQWYSELPFLTSVAVQSSWSYGNNVNLLASGYDDPSKGSGGSGLYAGKDGSLVNILPEKRTNALLVTKVPKLMNGRREYRVNSGDVATHYFANNEIPTINGAEQVPQQALLSDDLTTYATKSFTPTNGSLSLTLCDRGFCCEFTTDTIHHDSLAQKNVKYFRYRFVVFNGVRSFSGKATGGVETCGIISCTDDTPASCNRRFDTNDIIVHPTTFNSIVISGNFTGGEKVNRMPIAFNTDLQPLNASDVAYASSEISETQRVNSKFSLMKSRRGLMTFAIWGRNFMLDGKPATSRSSANHSSPFIFMLITLIVLGIASDNVVSPFSNVA